MKSIGKMNGNRTEELKEISRADFGPEKLAMNMIQQ